MSGVGAYRRPAYPAAALLLAVLTAPPLCDTLPQGTPTDGTSPVLGRPCVSATDCRDIAGAVCEDSQKCQCPRDFLYDNIGSCLPVVGVDGNCSVTAQCRPEVTGSECGRDGACVCRQRHYKHTYADGTKLCLLTETGEEANKLPVDPIMIGILVSLVLMFLIICVVLQLFSKARFRQNRTVLNSANPRLMNTSFFKAGDGSKAAGRRGSGVQRPRGSGSGSRGSQGSIVTTGVGSITGDDDVDDRTRLEHATADKEWRDSSSPGGAARRPKLTLPPLRTSGKQTPADDAKDRDSVVKQMKIEVAENAD